MEQDYILNELTINQLSRARFFFFSSRRRHTRLTCDWSSDVCSSDLADTGQVRCEVEQCSPVRERRDVAVVELEHIGEGIARRRREQQPVVLHPGERGVMLHHLQPWVPRAIRCEQLVLE